MILQKVFSGQLFEERFFANDGILVGMDVKSSVEKGLIDNVIRIIECSVNFPQNDIFLFRKFLFGERRVEGDVRQNFQRGFQGGCCSLDVVGCVIERRVGVNGGAFRLNGLRDVVEGALSSALEGHVLDKV